MAASTIPKSGGPGSSVELSPVTIAVRDKVIEKFADQPLDEMNNSVKNLLTHEEDEQKRLGILAARVYTCVKGLPISPGVSRSGSLQAPRRRQMT